MKILNAEQIRELDKCTIVSESIASIDLMERAAREFTRAVTPHLHFKDQVYIFCGMGNNGGDGLAIARMLLKLESARVKVFVVKHALVASSDFEINLKRLEKVLPPIFIESEKDIPQISSDVKIIDALFGSGLNRPLESLPAKVVQHINKSGAEVFSVDIPSGLQCSKPPSEIDTIIRSDLTFTFHSPKLSFLLPASAPFVKNFEVLDIGLNESCSTKIDSPYIYVNADLIRQIFKTRGRFTHKGTYGHALLVGGRYGKIGAIVLSVRAALRSGAGLVTSFVPKCGYSIIQTACPEAMVITDNDETELRDCSLTKPYKYIGVGPGLGVTEITKSFLKHLIKQNHLPLVLDADALNILSEEKELLHILPQNSILTPHPGEFKRLAGEWIDDESRLKLLTDFAQKHKVIVVLKGANTSTALPDGRVFFNSTGNPGMAKGGSGDVLTGVITSLLAQGYPSDDAAVTGVYVHGKAGDLAAVNLSLTGMNASDIVTYLPQAFRELE